MIQPRNGGSGNGDLDPERGNGGTKPTVLIQGLDSRRKRRESAVMLERMISTVPLDDAEFWEPIIAALQRGARNTTDVRGAARCASVLSTLRAQNAGILQYLDKNDRLDDGDPTEVVEHVFEATFDRSG